MAGVSRARARKRDRLLGIALAASILAAVPAGELRAAGFSAPPGLAAGAPAARSPVQPLAPAAGPSASASVPAAVDPESPGQPPPATAVQSAPRLDPGGTPHRPLHRRWGFWAVAGALVLGAVAITYAASRPGPEPYYGNLSPQVIVLP
jgi:hypothetical protein